MILQVSSQYTKDSDTAYAPGPRANGKTSVCLRPAIPRQQASNKHLNTVPADSAAARTSNLPFLLGNDIARFGHQLHRCEPLYYQAFTKKWRCQDGGILGGRGAKIEPCKPKGEDNAETDRDIGKVHNGLTSSSSCPSQLASAPLGAVSRLIGDVICSIRLSAAIATRRLSLAKNRTVMEYPRWSLCGYSEEFRRKIAEEDLVDDERRARGEELQTYRRAAPTADVGSNGWFFETLLVVEQVFDGKVNLTDIG